MDADTDRANTSESESPKHGSQNDAGARMDLNPHAPSTPQANTPSGAPTAPRLTNPSGLLKASNVDYILWLGDIEHVNIRARFTSGKTDSKVIACGEKQNASAMLVVFNDNVLGETDAFYLLQERQK